MSSLPRKDVNVEKTYNLLLKKEKLVKPASVMFRKQILEAQNRDAYKNEYDRIQGYISGYADRFLGQQDLFKLRNRQNELKKLFRQSFNQNYHPIQDKQKM